MTEPPGSTKSICDWKANENAVYKWTVKGVMNAGEFYCRLPVNMPWKHTQPVTCLKHFKERKETCWMFLDKLLLCCSHGKNGNKMSQIQLHVTQLWYKRTLIVKKKCIQLYWMCTYCVSDLEGIF